MSQQETDIQTELALIRQNQEAMKEDTSQIKEKIFGNGRPGLESRITTLETMISGNHQKFQQIMMLLTFGIASISLILNLIDKT